jgi:hypothetical protein
MKQLLPNEEQKCPSSFVGLLICVRVHDSKEAIVVDAHDLAIRDKAKFKLELFVAKGWSSIFVAKGWSSIFWSLFWISSSEWPEQLLLLLLEFVHRHGLEQHLFVLLGLFLEPLNETDFRIGIIDQLLHLVTPSGNSE